MAYGIWENWACEIRNLESGIWNPESHLRFEFGIQKFHWQRMESGTWNPESLKRDETFLSRASTRAKCALDRAAYSWNMVNLFSFGCHVIDRAYVRTYVRTYIRTYASTDCTGGVGETIKRKGGVSQACLGKSTSFTLAIHNMVNWQLSKQDSHWPVSHDHIAGSCVKSLRWRDLFGSCPLTS